MGEDTFWEAAGELCRVVGANLPQSYPCCLEKGEPYLTTHATKAECRMPGCKLMCMWCRQLGDQALEAN